MTVFPWNRPALERLTNIRLPHALLIHGPQGVGKLSLAQNLAQSLLCESPTGGMACERCPACGWFESSSHPDFRLLEPGNLAESENEEQGPNKGSARILIEQIRGLTDFINLSSHRGGRKVILIQPAEALNANAANALLKNLEEPPADTYFLLVAHRIHFLLPTIRSRCQQIALTAPEPEAAIEWLQTQGMPDPALALAHTGNAPLLARDLAERQYWQQREAFLEQIAAPGFNALAAAEEVCDYAIRDIVSWLQKWTFDLVFQKILGKVRYNPDHAATLSALAARIDPLSVLRFHREVLRLQRVIDHPLHPRLLVEQLLIDYAGALNTGAAAGNRRT
ncbi:MAG TPA: DNA polymerase III subunit delta' [Burkholderiales bacterium]|nr:DNA polymerase III subunit delta' [Burkholderiales bacterium]